VVTSLGCLLTVAIIGLKPSMPPRVLPAQELSRPLQGMVMQVVAGLEQHSMPATQSMPGMPDMNHEMPSSTHQWCDDVVWSTFNHRVTGWFLVLWGLTALIAGLQSASSWWRFAPPMFLFGLAEFLFFRNDPEAWPVGPMSYWASLRDPEDFQHRVFVLLIVLLGVVELLRAADRLPPLFAKYALPALGAFGAVFLFFHRHSSAMGAMMHQTESGTFDDLGMRRMFLSMNLIRHEHLWISLIGFALLACKLLADTGRLKGRWSVLWCTFAIVLGAYMTRYVE
jgi:hypothetical protein